MVEITQQQLSVFKEQFPHDARVQALTLGEIQDHAKTATIDWNSISYDGGLAPTNFVTLSPCQMAIGYVVFDTICLAVGAVGVRAGVTAPTIEAVGIAVAPSLSKIEQIVARMAAPNASSYDIAKGVFEILGAVYSGGSLGAVFSAFTASLSWWDALLYGITGMATIVAALATDGLAFAAEVAVLLATFGFLASDSVKAVQACSLTPVPDPSPTPTPTPTPGSDPFPFEPMVALKTCNGFSLTVVNGGGLGGQNVAIDTDRTVVGPWEKFTVVPLDAQGDTFALKTVNGNYVTAVNGGGIGGPNDASSPIHTDITWTRSWEQLILVQQQDGTYAISTPSGHYLTAVNGGGFGEAANQMPIHTDTTTVGPWETFTHVPV